MKRSQKGLVQAEERLETLSNEEKEFGKWFIRQLESLKHVPMDETVRDGQVILGNTCKVVATPGHTSGHISLYFPSIQSVITGDAAVNENHSLVIANPQFCLDMLKAEQSLTKIKNLKAKHYYCYHGGKLIL